MGLYFYGAELCSGCIGDFSMRIIVPIHFAVNKSFASFAN